MNNTFLTGITIIASLKNVTLNGASYPVLQAGDTLTCTVYSQNGVVQGTPVTATGDGAGNFSATITLPANAGSYYLQWDSLFAGEVGKQTLAFELRTKL